MKIHLRRFKAICWILVGRIAEHHSHGGAPHEIYGQWYDDVTICHSRFWIESLLCATNGRCSWRYCCRWQCAYMQITKTTHFRFFLYFLNEFTNRFRNAISYYIEADLFLESNRTTTEPQWYIYYTQCCHTTENWVGVVVQIGSSS